MARKTKQSKKDDEVRDVIRDVNELKNEMREIKNLLLALNKSDISPISLAVPFTSRLKSLNVLVVNTDLSAIFYLY